MYKEERVTSILMVEWTLLIRVRNLEGEFIFYRRKEKLSIEVSEHVEYVRHSEEQCKSGRPLGEWDGGKKRDKTRRENRTVE